MSFSVLADVAYALDLPEDEWVRELCVNGRSLLDEGSGIFAYSYDLHGDRVALRSLASEGRNAASDGVWHALNAWGARNQEQVVALYRTRPVQIVSFSSVASLSKQVERDLLTTFEPHDIRDLFAFVAHHRSGSGVVLTVPLTRSRRPTRVEERAFVEELGATLAGIVHLRRRRQAARRTVLLTTAERQVANLLLLGCSDKEIAHEMGLAMSSVSTLAQRIRTKLRCGKGQELLHLGDPDEEVALAQRRSLFERMTAAEREVAVELLAGATHAEIARERGCAVRTVAAQGASLFRKSGISGRRALAAALLGGRATRVSGK